jgi:hypothetical protein
MSRLKTNVKQAMAALEAEQAERREIIQEVRAEPVPSAPMPLMPRMLDLSQIIPVEAREESPVMYAAPPTNSGNGMPRRDTRTRFTLTKEEAEHAKAAGISVGEYVKHREYLREQKRLRPGDFPE